MCHRNTHHPGADLSQGHHCWWNTTIKATWGGEDLFGLHFHISVYRQRKSGQEPEDRSWCWNYERMLLACSSWLGNQSHFLIEPRTNCPGMAPPVMGSAPLHQSLIKEMPNRPAYSPILWRLFFSIEAPSSLMTVACASCIKLVSIGFIRIKNLYLQRLQ